MKIPVNPVVITLLTVLPVVSFSQTRSIGINIQKIEEITGAKGTVN